MGKIKCIYIKEICEERRYHVWAEIQYESGVIRKAHIGTGTSQYWDAWKNFYYLLPRTAKEFLAEPDTIQTHETKYDTIRHSWYFKIPF